MKFVDYDTQFEDCEDDISNAKEPEKREEEEEKIDEIEMEEIKVIEDMLMEKNEDFMVKEKKLKETKKTVESSELENVKYQISKKDVTEMIKQIRSDAQIYLDLENEETSSETLLKLLKDPNNNLIQLGVKDQELLELHNERREKGFVMDSGGTGNDEQLEHGGNAQFLAAIRRWYGIVKGDRRGPGRRE
jgi:hypothetical protein